MDNTKNNYSELVARLVTEQIICDGWETKKFPREVCTEKDKVDPTIIDSKTLHVCLVVDKRFGGRAELVTAFPYLYSTADECLFGWVASCSGRTFSHMENSVHDDDQIVIAWKKVNDGFVFK